MSKLERDFQANLIKELRARFPDCIILKNDANYLQGVPDILVLFRDRWATLEAKKSATAPFQPNQPYYIELMDRMSFSAAIYPANKDAVLSDLYEHFFG